jgi:hypothetical protein
MPSLIPRHDLSHPAPDENAAQYVSPHVAGLSLVKLPKYVFDILASHELVPVLGTKL